MTIELATAIAIVSLAFSIFFGLKNNGRASTKDIEERVKRETKLDVKVDDVLNTVKDIKYDISSVRKDISELNNRVTIVEAKADKANTRIDMLVGGSNETAKTE